MTYNNRKLILTGTINVNNCWFLARSAPEDRQNDIKQAIEKWLIRTNFEIIFVENSNADLTFLDELKALYVNRLETLSFDGNNYDRSFGKGYGEVLSINYALDHSLQLQGIDFFHKVAGRYFLEDIETQYSELEAQIGANEIDVFFHMKEELFREHNSIPTVYFGMKRSVYDKYLRNFHVNDNHGIYFEHGMFRAVIDMMSKSENKIFFTEKIGIESNQISGTNNHVIEHLK